MQILVALSHTACAHTGGPFGGGGPAAQPLKISGKWGPCDPSRSLNVIETDMNRSATYDFLLVIRSNHGPISYRFRDKR